jgi:Protein of unknown function (DUF2865)
MIDMSGAGGARPRFFGRLNARAVVCAAGLLLCADLGIATLAMAQSAECQQLRAAIAANQAPVSRESAGFDAAAQKQRAEIDKTVAYSRQIGCDRHKFLFFGNDPPPQCGEVMAQIARMQANLGQLQARGSGGGGGGALLARYQSECLNQPRPTTGFFEALFGRSRQDEPQSGLVDVPLSPDLGPQNPDETNPEGANAHAGSKAVCVRSCDGYFFPVSYSAGGHMSDLQEMCRALCPNSEVTLYSYSPSADIDQAVSIDGARYVDTPNAFKYRKTVDLSCSCRRRGQSWAQALQDAENLLGEHKNDIIVTQEKSDELARVHPDAKIGPQKPGAATAKPDAKGANAPPAQQELSPTEQMLGQQPATMSRETSGIAAGDGASGPSYGKSQGQTEEVVGPDGVKRRVRIIDPTL